jgi:UDP-2,3-diacylglucosamine pyrophosphatase LpxH
MRMPVGAYQLFQERLEDMAFDASNRDDETYEPIETFDLVLLGDIFDPLRSTQWTAEGKGDPGYARPWSDPGSPAFVSKIGQITDKILQENAKSLEILHSIAIGEGISLPPATKDHKVDRRISRDHRSKNRLPVKVNIHYMVGNHDWYYHLPGQGFNQIRQKIVDAMHLANVATAFPYEPSESRLVEQVFSEHGVFGRHGDFYDPSNYFKEYGRNHASLGDVLCVELFNPISVLVKSALKDELPDKFFDDLDEMGSIRPDVMTPVWIASLLERYQAATAHWKKVNEIWHDLVDQFLKLDYLDELNKPFEFDLIDKIRIALKLSNLISIETLTDWALAVEKLDDLIRLVKKGSGSYESWATKEKAYQSQEARFIVYGHTHNFTVYPLRSVHVKGRAFDQFYMNSGTWHPVHEICHSNPEKRGFIFHKTMSYLSFYKGDERKCRAYETWSGTLDI